MPDFMVKLVEWFVKLGKSLSLAAIVIRFRYKTRLSTIKLAVMVDRAEKAQMRMDKALNMAKTNIKKFGEALDTYKKEM
ncbi:unnamed protein product [marine sediment metagenome]|uniref:Uncharacterized protein n=1 Tax=marine sediment metagenome TaxID=412755 RepID=X0SVJ9_9ZZZZ